MESNISVVKCENGHFYDANKYASCPHCAKMSGEKIENVKVSEKISDKSSEWKCTKCGNVNNGKFCVECGAKRELSEPVKKQDQSNDFGPVLVEKEPEPHIVKKPSAEKSLKEDLKSDTVYDDDKTKGIFVKKVSPKSPETSTEVVQSEPVVGWIVCIEGNDLGKSYHIVSGNNSVGRLSENDIVLNDEHVSRKKHAIIVYEPKKRNFFIRPGEGSQLTYLNNENIMEAKPLKQNDVIEIGNGKYIFIPLCSEKFSWEDYIK